MLRGTSILGRQLPLIQRRTKIYTRTGDAGTSSIFTGERRPKDDIIFQSLGATDELSSLVGLARAVMPEASTAPEELSELKSRLEHVQCRLQDLGSLVATPDSAVRAKFKLVDLTPEHVMQLEHWIDDMDKRLPALRAFILPGGSQASATLHVARSVCRRAERTLVPLVTTGELAAPAYKYLNRLSDFLFTAARLCSQAEGVADSKYHAHDITKRL